MVIKLGRFGKFLSCSNYPECKNARPLAGQEGTKEVEDSKELIELKEKNNHLRVAAGLAANNEERDLAKQRINKLVREIDKCIALINE